MVDDFSAPTARPGCMHIVWGVIEKQCVGRVKIDFGLCHSINRRVGFNELRAAGKNAVFKAANPRATRFQHRCKSRRHVRQINHAMHAVLPVGQLTHQGNRRLEHRRHVRNAINKRSQSVCVRSMGSMGNLCGQRRLFCAGAKICRSPLLIRFYPARNTRKLLMAFEPCRSIFKPAA